MFLRDWYLQEQVEPALAPVPTPVNGGLAVAGQCTTLGSGAFTVDPSSWGLQDGDFILLVMVQAALPGAGNPAIYPTPFDTVEDSGWICLMSHVGTETPACSIFCRFYASGDTPYPFWRTANTIVCWKAYAYRGVSRRLPLDMVRRCASMAVGTQNDRNVTGESSLYGNSSILFGEWRQIGNYGLHVGANFYRVADSLCASASEAVGIFDYAASKWRGNRDAYVYMGTVGSGENRADLLGFVTRTSRRLNIDRDARANIGNQNNFAGWGTVNISLTAQSQSVDLFYRPTLLGGVSVSRQYSLRRSYVLAPGRRYYFRALLGAFASSVASGNTFWQFRVLRPDGGAVGFCASPISGANFYSSRADWPEWQFTLGLGFSGLPDRVIGDHGFSFTPTEGGIYTVALDPTDGSGYNVIDRIEPASNNFSTPIFGFAVGDDSTGVPSYQGVSDHYCQDMIGMAAWNTSGGSIASSIEGFLQIESNEETKTPLEFQILGASLSSVPAVRVINMVHGMWRWPYNAALTGVETNVTAWGHFSPANPDLNHAIAADRCVPPFYRLTEDGSLTDGRYYWEVTVNGTAAAIGVNRIGWFAMPAWVRGPVTTATMADGSQYGITGAGDSRAGLTATDLSLGASIAPGTVLGFALDIPGGTLDIYRDGSLQHSMSTILPTSGNYPNGNRFLNKISPWRAVACFGQAKDTSESVNDVRCVFNFAGPFVYPKPTGYVAYDFLNEVP